jgi:hypothetical protein
MRAKIARWTALAVALAGAASAAAPETFSARYEVFLGGLRGGEVTLVVNRDGARYEARADLRAAGLAGLLFPGSAQAEASGAANGGSVAPARFEADGAFGRERQRVEMAYGGAEGLALRADPPLRDRGYDVEVAAMADALDPLSAAVVALVPRPAALACDRVIPVFDSRRRFELRLGTPVATEDGLRCEGAFRRIAGYKAKHLRQPDHPFTVWWRVADGVATLERAVAPTPFGHAVARRR